MCAFVREPIVRVVFFVSVLLLVSGLPVAGQLRFEGIPFIKNYTRQDYHSSPFNWGVVQDARGVLFVANNYNLLQFDGTNWRATPMPNRTVARSLAVDKNGRVYYGGQADFGYLTPDARGEVGFVSLRDKLAPEAQNFTDVWKIMVTEDGVLFCTFAGLYLLKQDTVQFYQLDQQALGLTSFFYISHRVFVCTEKQGIFEFRSNQLVKVPQSEAVASYRISGMLPAQDNTIVLVTQKHGLFRYDGYSGFEAWPLTGTDFLEGNVLVSSAAIPGGYVLGSSHNGLLIVDRTGVPLIHLNKATGLQNDGIEYIYPDNNGNLWLALRDGVDYVEINSPFTFFNSRCGIAGAGFTSWIADGRLYLGTSEGLYTRPWNVQKGPPTDKAFRLVPGTEGQTYTLQKPGGTLLLTHNNGVYKVRGDRAMRVGDQTGAWLFVPLRQHPGYAVCGGYDGLMLYRLTDDAPVFLWKIAGFDASSRVMEQDAQGNLWVAHGYIGLYKLTLSADLRSVAQQSFYDSSSGFPSNVFINVFKVNNELVFTGERGIYSYSPARDRFVAHAALNAVIGKDSHTRKLIEDRDGNVWFASGDELGILKKHNGQHYEVTKTIFNKLQRRLVGGFEHIAYYDDHTVIIGTDDGFVHFDPSFIFNTDHTFTTLIRSVEVTTETDSLLSGGWFGVAPADATVQPLNQRPMLSYAYNALRFTFSATSYEDASQVQYQYKLQGHDANWSAWGLLTRKEYTNLKEGEYTFLVKSKDIYNREGSVAAYSFTVLPPWHRTVWAYSAYVVLTALLLVGVYRVARHEQQKTLRFREIEHQEDVLRAEKEIIKLTNEKLESELLHKNKELASSAMHSVHSVETIQKIRTSLIAAIDAVHDQDAKNQMRKVLRSIANEITMDTRWDQFELHFNQLHDDFLVRLRKEYPNLTHNDIKLISYLKLNLSSKEIAPLLNLSVRGVEASRYRIRKKMNLTPHVNLTDFILKY